MCIINVIHYVRQLKHTYHVFVTLKHRQTATRHCLIYIYVAIIKSESRDKIGVAFKPFLSISFITDKQRIQ